MEDLKPSMFNVEFSHNGLNYVYNSRTTTLAEIDKSFSACMEDDSLKDELIKNGFATLSSTDELNEFLNVVNEEINKIPDRLELTVVLTEMCNFNCIYCYQTKNSKVFSNEDVGDVVNCVERLFDKGLNSLVIHYFGGEPLLNLSALRMLDKALKHLCKERNKEFQSYITTNGSLITSSILTELNFDTIQLTFDGDIDKHQNFKISKTFGYKDLLNTVDMVLKQSNSNLRIRFNICKENADSFVSVLDEIFALDSFDTERVIFAFNPMRNYSNSDAFTELSPVEYSKINLTLRKHVLSLGKKLVLPRSTFQPCKFTVGNALCIGPKCTPYFCSSSFYDKPAKSTLESFMDKKDIQYNFPNACKECAVLPICLCSCKLLDPEKNACIPEKYILIDLLKMYLDQPEMWEV